MFTLQIPDDIITKLRAADAHSPSITAKLTLLHENPSSAAMKTNIKNIGDYYVNAGRYCILFNMDIESQTIEIINVVLAAYLHKVFVGWVES